MKASELMLANAPLTQEECDIVDELIPIKKYEKGKMLLRPGQVAVDSYYLIEGCMRSYYIIDGEEKTTEFFLEGDSVASLESYLEQKPADHYYECVEDCLVAVMNFYKEQELTERFPKFESMCRLETEKNFGKKNTAFAKFISSSPEQRYLNLLESRPELMNRVPQYQLASYLGMKPESLSRIRKRVAEKKTTA